MAKAQTVSDQTDEAPRKSLSEIASQQFRTEFTGEAKPAAPVDAQPDRDAGDEDVGDDVDLTSEGEEPEGEGVEADSDGYTSAAGEDDEEEGHEPASEGDDRPVETLEELVATLEADPDWAQGLKVQVKVHDEVSQVPIKDLVASYQMGEAGEKVLEKAKAYAENQKTELAAQAEAVEVAFHAAAKLIEEAEKAILGEVSQADLAELRNTDPAEWSARVQELNAKQNSVAQMKQNLVQQYQQNKAQIDATKATNKPDLQAETMALMEKMPKVDPRWGDPQQLPAVKAELATYLVSQGFSEQEALGASDHRQLLLAQKAALWDAAQKKVDTAKKRVAKIPKMVRPGSSKPAEHVQSQALKKARARLRQAGTIDDAFAVLKSKRR